MLVRILLLTLFIGAAHSASNPPHSQADNIVEPSSTVEPGDRVIFDKCRQLLNTPEYYRKHGLAYDIYEHYNNGQGFDRKLNHQAIRQADAMLLRLKEDLSKSNASGMAHTAVRDARDVFSNLSKNLAP